MPEPPMPQKNQGWAVRVAASTSVIAASDYAALLVLTTSIGREA
jgi:hypothetical protein